MYCYHCGKEIRNDSWFCQFCGMKVGESLEKEDDIEIVDINDENDYLDEEDDIEIIGKNNRDSKEKTKKNEQVIGYVLITGMLTAIILMIVISSFRQGFGETLYGTWYRIENYANTLGEEISFDKDGNFFDGNIEGRYNTEDGRLTLYYNALAGEYSYDYEIEAGKLYLYKKGDLKYVFSENMNENDSTLNIPDISIQDENVAYSYGVQAYSIIESYYDNPDTEIQENMINSMNGLLIEARDNLNSKNDIVTLLDSIYNNLYAVHVSA